ncbi:MAG: sugar phosphate isomerase/epimerase family protein, partial [Bryobacteraceae bacterium]
IREAKSLGVRCGQLGIPGDLPLAGMAEDWKSVLARENFTVITAFCAYTGESYADIPTVEATVGYIPRTTRAEREARTIEVSDFAAAAGIPGLGCHAGFVPEDHGDPDYVAVRDLIRRVCDHAAGHGQTFALETGQEPADQLLQFFKDVDRPNLGINFDPANMILYGTGDPIDALGLLGKHVISVHAKDGAWPPKDSATALGVEMPLGQGAVGMERFLAKLKQVGFRGPLNVEREVEDHARKLEDMKMGVALLRGLLGA